MRLAVGVFARLVVLAAFALIVGDALVTLWQRGDYFFAVVAVVVFPATIFIWPWQHAAFGISLIWVFIAAVVAYPISTFVGGLDSI